MLEKYLINHCAPTLASLKTANLFNCEYESEALLNDAIEKWSIVLKSKGVSIAVLRKVNSKALVYVYRSKRLLADLKMPNVSKFLSKSGYIVSDSANDYIDTLKYRLASSDEFPHEIGLFLGYPLEDVIGFIENKGQNCKCSGCWKVYCDECYAKNEFKKYAKCTRVYKKLFECGKRGIVQLTVA